MPEIEGTTTSRRRTYEIVAMISLLAIFLVVSFWKHGHNISRETIGIIIAAGLTLIMYSFLYRDNPLYKIAENLYVGVAAGYTIIIAWRSYIYPEIYARFFEAPTQEALFDALKFRIWPVLLGILLLMRLSKKHSWVSRYSYALMVGWGAGLAIVMVTDSLILEQLAAAIKPVSEMPAADKVKLAWMILSSLFVLVSTLAVLWYFFFSLEHKGVGGGVSKWGILVLMVAFGASFGYTVMARISLLIGRVQFLMEKWLNLGP